jgi:quercetin dioxygenase-like cupin family protein
MLPVRARRRTIIAGALAGGAALACHTTAPGAPAGGAQVRTANARDLPAMDGGRLKATVVEVTYGPGASSPPHSHPCPVIGYVLEGTLRTQVKGQPGAVYQAGASFYEAPNGVHQVSANASGRKPARLLAYFICDRDTPLSTPVADPASARDGRQ